MKAVLLVLGLLLGGCSSSSDATPPAAAPSPSADGRVTGTLAGTELRLEVADDEQERSVGLMRRTSVPAGTGMVFLYGGELSEGRYYMYDVPIPLRATFIRAGKVVSTVVMPPCRLDDPQACPTYGAEGPYDTVVETDPSVAPDPKPGDPFTLQG